MGEWIPENAVLRPVTPLASLEEYHAALARRHQCLEIQAHREAGWLTPEAEDEAESLEVKVYDYWLLRDLKPDEARTPAIEAKPGELRTNAPENEANPLPRLIEVRRHNFKNPADSQDIAFKIIRNPQNVYNGSVEWQETFHVYCTDHSNKTIGHAVGIFVDRERIRSRFAEHMFMPSGVLRDIATWVFDRYGRLRAEYRHNATKKRLNTWGDELDTGAFLVIKSVYVHPEWRRNRLARELVDRLIEKAKMTKDKPAVSVLAVPGWLETDLEEEPIAEQVRNRTRAGKVANVMFLQMGFRRIGSSPCLGLRIDAVKDLSSINPDEVFSAEGEKWVHGDANEIGHPFGDWETQLKWFKQQKSNLPILYATAILSDDDLVEHYDKSANSYKTEVWLKTDLFHRNVLHLAALGFKPKSVRWLLEREDIAKHLKNGTTTRGYAPLEELQLHLEMHRITDGVSLLSDIFGGFCHDAITCLGLLKLSPAELDEGSQISWLRLSFGCDCGKCIRGLISARMRHVLCVQAEYISYKLTADDLGDNFWGMMTRFWTENLCLEASQNFQLNKLRLHRDATIFKAIHTLVSENNLPTIVRIKKEIKKVLKKRKQDSRWLSNLPQARKVIQTALKILFEFAKEQDECASTKRWGQNMDVYRDTMDRYLEKCRNDQEYGFIAVQCGVSMNWRFSNDCMIESGI